MTSPPNKSVQLYVIAFDRFDHEEETAKKRYHPEDVITKLRKAGVHINRKKAVAETLGGITFKNVNLFTKSAGEHYSCEACEACFRRRRQFKLNLAIRKRQL